MVNHVFSGLLLIVLTSIIATQAGLTTVCVDLCTHLPYEGDMDECVEACEILILSELENSVDGNQAMYEEGGEGNGLDGELFQPGDKRGSLSRGARQKSTFVRIGRSVDGLQDEYDDEQALEEASKRASAFVRIGRNRLFPYGGASKKSLDDSNKRASSFVRIGRPSSFVRIGRDPEKRASSFVRIGRPGSGFVRIGKSQANTKRPSSFVRIGKSMDTELLTDQKDEEDVDKRASSFVRIGKNVGIPAPSSKRTSTFVRIGKGLEDEEGMDSDKRASNFVRIGKSVGESMDDDKRASKFVRIGKRSPSS